MNKKSRDINELNGGKRIYISETGRKMNEMNSIVRAVCRWIFGYYAELYFSIHYAS